MKRYFIVPLLILMIFLSGELYSQNMYSDKLVHTYSIVARDPNTGEMGVAVQSHWFSVGSIVSWAEAGVGAIATQSFVNVSFGPRGLELLNRLGIRTLALPTPNIELGHSARASSVFIPAMSVSTHGGPAFAKLNLRLLENTT